jgi:hypothetical protein
VRVQRHLPQRQPYHLVLVLLQPLTHSYPHWSLTRYLKRISKQWVRFGLPWQLGGGSRDSRASHLVVFRRLKSYCVQVRTYRRMSKRRYQYLSKAQMGWMSDTGCVTS